MNLGASYIVNGLELARKLGMYRGTLQTLAGFFWRRDLPGPQRQLLERSLAPVYRVAREHPERVLFDVPGSHDGELRIGHLPNGSSFGLRLGQLALGTLIVGSTGSGKTTLLRALALAIFRHLNSGGAGGAWLVDHQKADLEALVPLAREQGAIVSIATSDLPINPLERPAGVAARIWAARVLSILSFALQLSEIASLHLRPILMELCEREDAPSWSDLVNAVKGAPGVLDSVRRPLLLRLEGIAMDLPSIARTRHGVPIQELERRLIYFPLYRFPRDHARLIYAWATWAAYTRRTEQRIQTTEPDLFKIEDEIGFAYDSSGGNEFIGMLCAVQRSSGIAFIGANQTFDLLPAILANTNTKIVGRVATTPDLRVASELLVLDKPQQEYLVSQPRPGQFLARLPSGHLQPFPFTGLNPESRVLADRERKAAERFLFEELKLRVDPDGGECSPTPSGARPPDFGEEMRIGRPILTEDESNVLRSCHDLPFIFLAERARQCGLNSARMSRVKQALKQRGLVIERELETCRAGARPRLLEITPEGCNAISRCHHQRTGREGGFLHHFGKHLASTYYARQGFETELERDLGGGAAVDVLATSKWERVAIEVQCSIDHAAENLAKLSQQVSRVEFLCFTAPVRNQLERMVAADSKARVHHFSYYSGDSTQWDTAIDTVIRDIREGDDRR